MKVEESSEVREEEVDDEVFNYQRELIMSCSARSIPEEMATETPPKDPHPFRFCPSKRSENVNADSSDEDEVIIF